MASVTPGPWLPRPRCLLCENESEIVEPDGLCRWCLAKSKGIEITSDRLWIYDFIPGDTLLEIDQSESHPWCGFYLDYIGFQRDTMPPEHYPVLIHEPDTDHQQIIELRLQRAFRLDVPICLEIAFNPTIGFTRSVQIRDDKLMPTVGDLRLVAKLYDFLGIIISKPGRKLLEEEPWQDWRVDAEWIIEARRSGRYTSERAAARARNIPYGTFRKWKARLKA